MHFTVMASNSSPHQKEHQIAITEGLKANGANVVLSSNRFCADTENVVCWGWRIGKTLKEAGHNVLVMERGYLGDRFKWTSLAWNGLNGYGKFAEICDDGERFSNISKLHPWKEKGDFILVMGQVPGDQSLKGQSLLPWYEKMVRYASEAYNLPVFFRQHPLAYKKGNQPLPKGAGLLNCSLEKSLEKAALVITYNSNSGVDSVISGTPIVAWDEGSMAWSVASHAVSEIVRPEREKWAYSLAWKQWTIEEIKSGFAVSNLLKVNKDG